MPRIRGDGGKLGLGCTATGDDLLVLDNNADDAECIVDSALKLVDDVLSAALDDDGDCFGVLALLDEGHLFSADFALFNKTGVADFFLADSVNA